MKNKTFRLNKQVEEEIYLVEMKIIFTLLQGTQYSSVSNLSSVWASTVNSKWPSFHSFDEQDLVEPLIEEEDISLDNSESPLIDAEHWVINSPEQEEFLNEEQCEGYNSSDHIILTIIS